ncbi:MAG TPA: thioredoxin family protein, partial [Candidatus Akkermansia intestinigallinarum]|nr:thioredoxin family protein [Candidatus Akkermansia intestinigallinarum]
MQNAFISLLTVAAIVAPACGAEWLTDLEAAKKQAAAENKAILVDFTGSDWCGYCI